MLSSPLGSVHLGDFEFGGTERYEVLSRLGAGGMGAVYKVLDRETGTHQALKALHATRPEALLRFKNEFRALQGIRHPNLVRLGELGQVEGVLFFTMELIDGVDFLTYVQARRGDPGVSYHEQRLRGAIAQLARGLGALHAAGKVHRDVKPLNIRVTGSGRLVLLDFGLVIDLGNPERLSEGWVIGTAAYMAPEQAYTEGAGPASDFYAVGSLLYHALTGQLPFEGGDLEVLMRKQKTEPPAPSTLVEGIPEDLDALCVDLLSCDPARRPTELEILRRLGDEAVAKTPRAKTESAELRASVFVGREREVDALVAGLAAPRSARTFVIRGPSGVGKSALVQQFQIEAARQVSGLVVLSGRCFENESVPFKGIDGIVDALTSYMRQLPRDGAAALLPRNASLLALVFPVLRRVDVVAESPPVRGDLSDAVELRRRALAALRELFARIALRHPLVVAIDDMQWADADSLALLADLMRPPEAPPMMLVLSARPTDDRRDRALLELPGSPRCFDLGPLDDPDATRLAADLLERAGIPTGADHAATLAREAGGHPMFLQELVLHVATVGMDKRHMAKLDDALQARIHKLAAPARRIFELVCVAGAPTSQETMAIAAELDFADYLAWASELRAVRLVRTGGGRRRDTIEPYHNRIREAALRMLTADEEREYHRLVAQAFEVTGEALTAPDLVLDHLTAAGETARAAYHAERAAERAREALAFDRAVARYRLALRVSELTDGERARLELELADTLCNAGRGTEATEIYMRHAARAQPAVRLEFQRRAAEQLLFSGHIDEGRDVLAELLAGVGDPLPKTQRRALWALAWQRLRLRLRGLGWKPHTEQDLRPRDLARVDLYLAASKGLSLIDNIRGAAYESKALRMALELGERTRLIRALSFEGVFQAAQCGLERARTVADLCRELAAETEEPISTAYSLYPRAAIHYFVENMWRSAWTVASEAEALLRGNVQAAGWEVDTMQIYSCFCMLYLGELAELARCEATYVHDAERRGDRYQSVSLRSRLIVPWLLADDPDSGARSVDESMRSWSSDRETFQVQHFYELHSRCELALYTGDARGAATAMARRLGPLKQSMLLRLPVVAMEITYLRARIALAQAAATAAGTDRDTLIDEVRRFARSLGRIRQPVAPGLAALARAGAASLVDDLDGAAKHLRRAVEVLDETDTNLYALPARRRLGALVGGDEGRQLVAECDEWLDEQGARNAAALIDMLAPGFGGPAAGGR